MENHEARPYQSLNVIFIDEQGDQYAAVVLRVLPNSTSITVKAFGEHGYDRVVTDVPYSATRLHRACSWHFAEPPKE